MVIGPTGQEVTVIDFFKIESGQKPGRREFFPMCENVLVKAMVPIWIGEERLEFEGHTGRLGDQIEGVKEKRRKSQKDQMISMQSP